MMREAKTAMLRVRCEKALKRRLINIAAAQGVDLSDAVRIACLQYVGQYGILPLTKQRRTYDDA